MIHLNNVSLSIPIYNSETRFLKRKIIQQVAGGILKIDSNNIPTVKALSNINCTINHGDRVALLGHNGSGKTSFLKVISGIYKISRGFIKKDINVFPMIQKSYITSEELWACTSCNACTDSCPIELDPLSIILDMRRYLVMEKSAEPTELNMMFTNVENNGAPWQFSAADRLNWKNE